MVYTNVVCGNRRLIWIIPGSEIQIGGRQIRSWAEGKGSFLNSSGTLLIALNVRRFECSKQRFPEIPNLPVYAQKRCRPDAA